MMNDSELDTLLNEPLPERDAAAFSVALMERIAHHEARPARIAAWIMAALLTVVVAAACVFAVPLLGRSALNANLFVLPALLAFLSLLLSYVVFQSARE